ncbi:MAG: AAA family ATPase [Phycisphaerae bacterium]|nr:AAA family ATPase [Phycisphaerae bacterium]
MNTTQRSHRLKSFSVAGGFLDGLEIDFADGLNCLIGHRGTGKTTVLEFVRYALDAFAPGEAGQLCRRRVEDLVKTNLGDGRIRLAIETKEGLEYIVDRTASGEPMVLSADGQPTEIAIGSGGLFGADIFSQNEVENIADSPQSQLALIDAFAADEIGRLGEAIDAVDAELQANAKALASAERTTAKLADELGMLKSVEDRIAQLANGSGENVEAMNAAQTHKALRDREAEAVGEAEALFEQYVGWFREAEGGFMASAERLFADDMRQGPNGNLLGAMCRRMRQAGEQLDGLLRQAASVLSAAKSNAGELAEQLRARHRRQELAFRELLSRQKRALGQATERAQAESKRNELLGKKRQHVEGRRELTRLRQQRQGLLDRLTDLRDHRFELRTSVSGYITDSVSSPVRVRVDQHGNRDRYVAMLTDALRPAAIQHKQVAGKIAGLLAPSELVHLVRNSDNEGLCQQAGLNASQGQKVVAALSAPEVLLEIETVELGDLPRIELHDGDDWKDSLSLSTGQKCTAILPILLLDSANPLLVDQPEDNLDNRFIYETIVEGLRRVKAGRQIVLITHNPNIPVLGDAAGVFVLSSDGAQGRLLNGGDVEACKPEIINLLEGGQEAFAQRRRRYGD